MVLLASSRHVQIAKMKPANNASSIWGWGLKERFVDKSFMLVSGAMVELDFIVPSETRT
jgi:hypothetical protein